MQEIKTSKGGIDYIHTILRDSPQVITKASFWKILHTNSGRIELSLKVGRYKKTKILLDLSMEELESQIPKSELTLTGEEFGNLIAFLELNIEPFQQGVKKYIPLDATFDQGNIEHIKALFANPEKQQLLDFILAHEIIPEDLFKAFNQLQRVKSIEAFEAMLEEDFNEHEWQKWFQQNDWVLGTEFVKVLDERKIDTSNISDFLMQAYDGFLDIVEIKRPGGDLKFWSDQKDHDNYIPHSDLIKAITQASKYIYEIEREANSIKFLEKVGNVKTIKPRCILIYGRSMDWNDEQKESYRIMNAGYHNLSILTYDHILERAKRMIA